MGQSSIGLPLLRLEVLLAQAEFQQRTQRFGSRPKHRAGRKTNGRGGFDLDTHPEREGSRPLKIGPPGNPFPDWREIGRRDDAQTVVPLKRIEDARRYRGAPAQCFHEIMSPERQITRMQRLLAVDMEYEIAVAVDMVVLHQRRSKITASVGRYANFDLAIRPTEERVFNVELLRAVGRGDVDIDAAGDVLKIAPQLGSQIVIEDVRDNREAEVAPFGSIAALLFDQHKDIVIGCPGSL